MENSNRLEERNYVFAPCVSFSFCLSVAKIKNNSQDNEFYHCLSDKHNETKYKVNVGYT